jgi:hypothetical protein
MFTTCSVYPNLRHVRSCSLAFQKEHPRKRRELPCSIHTPANPTSRIEYGTHASKPPPKSPQKYGYVKHRVLCSLLWAHKQCPSVALGMTCVVQTISREFMGLIRQTLPTTPALSWGLTTLDDGLLLASRLSYNWLVLGYRRAWRCERGACSWLAYVCS